MAKGKSREQANVEADNFLNEEESEKVRKKEAKAEAKAAKAKAKEEKEEGIRKFLSSAPPIQ